MQVNGKILLESAENILKSRRQENRSQETSLQKGHAAHGTQKAKASSVQANLNNARMLKLESELKGVQESYTREQVRENFLLNSAKEINEKLEYKGRPLFPEYKPGMDTQSLAKDVSSKLKQLLHSLKSIQVEIENFYALSFENFSTQEASFKQIDDSLAVKPLDPERVAQLTKS